ncbi:MAG: hypothetical protein IMZ55_07305 [Acidobacteria bacterium]|nr:hypothetical protein [Acidobacteriota bacterium]
MAVFLLVVAAAVGRAEEKESHFLLGFFGQYPFGQVNTAVVSPEDSYADFNPIDFGYGFGLSVEYRLAPSLRLFLDGSHSSFWVYEMTGYTTNQLHFNDDVFMYMDTTGFRLGAKLVLPGRGIQPWIGAGVGYYRWDAAYMTGDRSSTWGSDGGYAWGLTYLGGVDIRVFEVGGNGLWLTVYADLAAPAVFPVIENLFQAGWTWDNSGGNPIMGPYRVGAGFAMPI